MSETRLCRKCNAVKSLADFKWSRAVKGSGCVGRIYYGHSCKRCDNQRRKHLYEGTKDAVHWDGIRRRYGLTREQWVAIFESQGRRCACCSDDDAGSVRGWQVDHDHVTGVVRGILCINCNRLLGAARDDVRVLQQAINYLEQPRPDAPLVPSDQARLQC